MRRASLVLGVVASASLAQAAPAPDPAEVAAAATLRAACRANSEAAQRIEIPTPPLEWRDGGLSVDLSRAISLEGGQVELYRPAGDDDGLAPLPMTAEQGAALVRAQARQKLAARLTFELAAGALVEAPCLALAGGRILRARYRPVQLELFDLGGEEGRTRRKPAVVLRTAAAMEAERGVPGVQVGPLTLRRGDEGARVALERALQEVELPLRRCYAEAIARRAELTGRLVLGLTIEHGRFVVARTELDSLGDAQLATCARGGVEAAHPPAGVRATTFSLPIGFLRR